MSKRRGLAGLVHALASLLLLGAVVAVAEEVRPGVLRTPDARFANLPDFDYEPNYVDIDGYRVHYVDAGPRSGEVVLLLHGEPTWSFLYRKMIPVLTEAGYRAIAPDLIGFGRSDKPTEMDIHTYAFHVGAMAKLVESLGLDDVTLFGQDWGGLIGLRVAAEREQRFARIVISNTWLPIGRAESMEALEAMPEERAFARWKKRNLQMIEQGDMPTGTMLSNNTRDPKVKEAYDAPFPDPSYKAGPLIMPQRVPVFVDDPANEANGRAWEVLERWEKPFLTAFSDNDRITRGRDVAFQERVPGAKGQKHTTIEGAGHFVQEEKGEELAQVVVQFLRDNPLPSGSGGASPGAGLLADQIPIAHTPEGYWTQMPPPVLAECTEALVKEAIDMRGMWKVVQAESGGERANAMIGSVQRIEQCGNRVVITSGGVTHDMRCDGTYENGVNDIGAPGTGGRKISVAASFEDRVHVLRPKGMDITVERELDGSELIWRYGPALVLRLERTDL